MTRSLRIVCAVWAFAASTTVSSADSINVLLELDGKPAAGLISVSGGYPQVDGNVVDGYSVRSEPLKLDFLRGVSPELASWVITSMTGNAPPATFAVVRKRGNQVLDRFVLSAPGLLDLSVGAMGPAQVVPRFAIRVISPNVSVLGPATPAPVAPDPTVGGPFFVRFVVGNTALQPLAIDGLGVRLQAKGGSCNSFKVLFQVDDVAFVYQWYNEGVGLKPGARVKAAQERRVEIRLQPTNDDKTLPFALIEGVRIRTFDPFVDLSGIAAAFDCARLTLDQSALR